MLTIEDGTGRPDAESFAAVAMADAYFAARGNEAWPGLALPAKEAALRQATDYMEAVFGRLWRSVRQSDEQALAWPREGWHGVPVAVQRACAELAFRASAGPLLPDQGPQVKRERVDVLEVEYQADTRQGVRYVHVWAMLGPFLDAAQTQVQAVRA